MWARMDSTSLTIESRKFPHCTWHMEDLICAIVHCASCKVVFILYTVTFIIKSSKK